MKESDKITGLFRDRLADAQMTVREGFWEELQVDLSRADKRSAPVIPVVTAPVETRKTSVFSSGFYRVAAAASVVMLLGAASAAFWFFSPKEEIKEAFTQVATLTPDASLNGDVAQETFPTLHQAESATHNPVRQLPVGIVPASMTAQAEEEEETVSVRFSVTITQRGRGNGYQNAGSRTFTDGVHSSGDYRESEQDTQPARSSSKSHKWALKAGIGTSLPKGDYHMPLTAAVTVERSLNNYLALETGLQYNRLHDGSTIHTLGIPVKLNVMLASTPKVDFYATVGGAAEKCIAGAADNGFNAEPIQLSVVAGVGVRYKLSDRFALFAEPSVSHHFDTDSRTRTLRTERPTNLNLLCGVRMTY